MTADDVEIIDTTTGRVADPTPQWQQKIPDGSGGFKDRYLERVKATGETLPPAVPNPTGQ